MDQQSKPADTSDVSVSGEAADKSSGSSRTDLPTKSEGEPWLSRLLFCLLFFSGASALIYEVAWVRMLALAVGSTTQAASCVIAAFLGGLALGGVLAGKLGARIRKRHLLIYGILELSIAVAAPAVSFLLHDAPSIFVSMSRSMPESSVGLTAARLLLSSILLLPPTILMGMTLPIVVALLSKLFERPAHFFSLLYGSNTLGAVVGTLVAAYLGFPFLGVSGTIFLAAGLNLTVALTAITCGLTGMGRSSSAAAASSTESGLRISGPNTNSRASAAVEQDADASTVAGPAIDPVSGTAAPPGAGANAGLDTTTKTSIRPDTISRFSLRSLCLVAAFLGLTSLSYEVLWIRLIKAFMTSSTYAFTSMVSTFLLGLVIGSFIYNRKLTSAPRFCDDLGAQLKMLALSQYGAGITTVVGVLLLPAILVVEALWPWLSTTYALPSSAWLVLEFVMSFALLIVPASFIGLTFPLIGGLAASHSKSVAEAVGDVYAANTAGCIIGSLMCGLLLIPTIGSQYAMSCIIALTIATALFIDYRLGSGSLSRRGMLVALLLIILAFVVPNHYVERMYASMTKGELLSAREDAIGRATTVKYRSGKRLIVNGTMYSGDTVQAMRYMRSLAHLPVLLNPAPKTALVVCFGIGTTAGAVAKHDEIEHLDICEISPAVLAGADQFTATNDGVVHKAKVSCLLEDGRNYLLRTNKKYDVISFEPPPPCEAGVVNLYSREFYELCRRHLNPGGILCQWAPMHNESSVLWKMMVKTMADVFPYTTVWLPNSLEAITLGCDRPLVIDPQLMRARIDAQPAVKASLAEVGLSDPYSIASTYYFGPASFSKYLSNLQPITDDHPALEFFLPYSGRSLYPCDLDAADPHEVLSHHAPIDERTMEANAHAMSEVRKGATAAWQGDAAQAQAHAANAHRLVPDNQYLQKLLADPTAR